MKFSRSIAGIVRVRRSWRSYLPEPIPEAAASELDAAAQSLSRGLSGEPARFALVRWEDKAWRETGLSDHGAITYPRHFLVGAVRQSDTAHLSYGYLVEQLVLKATDLGLGTCWLGYFDPRFTGEFKPGPDEVMPAICVVGPTAENPGMKDKLTRFVVGAARRRDWDELFWNGSFGAPLTPDLAGRYAQPLDLLRLAPSAGNTQPWRVVRAADGTSFHLFLKPVSARYDKRRLHDIDLGIAMCHFELSCRELGLAGKWERNTPGIDVPAGVRYVFTWQTSG